MRARLSFAFVGMVSLLAACAGNESDSDTGGSNEGGEAPSTGGAGGGTGGTGGSATGGSSTGGQDVGGQGGEGGEGGQPVMGCPQDCSTIEVPACFVATCNEETHSCDIGPAEDGSACEDGEYCTVDDTCVGGTCEAGGPRDCTGGGGDDCNTSSCDEDLDTCSAAPVANGTPCTSTNVCLTNTACFNGQCQGAPMDCSATPLDAPECQAAECDPATGMCVVVPVNDGVPCTYGDICESDKECLQGECLGTPIPDCQACTETEANNTYSAANTGAGCASWAGAITVVGDKDCFAVDVTVAGSRILAQTTDVNGQGCPSGFDSVIRLYNSAGTALASDDQGAPGSDGCSMFLPTNAATTNLAVGTYYVCVEDYLNNGTTPPYLLLLSAAPPGCGNQIIETPEECDGTALASQTCVTQGFGSGTLACDSNCEFDTSQCAAPFCGDGLKNGTEDCDGAALGGATCVSEGFAGGSLACDASCGFNTAGCVAAGCGNAILEFGEDCEGGANCSAMCTTFTCAAGEVPFSVTSSDVPYADIDSETVNSVLTVSTVGTIKQVGVQLNISSTWDSDVDISLTPPASPMIDLSSDNGSSSDHYTNTVFSPTATTAVTAGTAPFSGQYLPEGNMTTMYNTAANGTWTLTVTDDLGGFPATLNAWRVFGCIQP
ncbi:MAG: hypothetical protein HOW73_42725 [Polyangiaceae bacterium]|nr:hypothetical protein [Polyangiaceae bacterium]